MIRAGRDEGRVLDGALDGLAQVFGSPATASRVGEHFTCAEADHVAWCLVASHHTDAAAIRLHAHAASDSDGDRHGDAGFDAIEYVIRRG
jgi:hypothetical protein